MNAKLLWRRALGAGAALALLASGAVWAGAGPPPAPPPPKADPLVDPNADEPMPGSVNVPAAAPSAPVVAAPAANPASPSSGPADAALVEKGHAMYRDYCQKCHGLNMVSPGGGFFDLRTFPHDDKARFISSVTNGKRAMPAWGAVLKPADIDTVWAYVSSYGGR